MRKKLELLIYKFLTSSIKRLVKFFFLPRRQTLRWSNQISNEVELELEPIPCQKSTLNKQQRSEPEIVCVCVLHFESIQSDGQSPLSVCYREDTWDPASSSGAIVIELHVRTDSRVNASKATVLEAFIRLTEVRVGLTWRTCPARWLRIHRYP